MILVGTKSDLENERTVSTAEAQELGRKLKVRLHLYIYGCMFVYVLRISHSQCKLKRLFKWIYNLQ